MNGRIPNLTDDQTQMVRGIAQILLGVKDLDNRMELAKSQIQKFKDEQIHFNYAGFLSMAGLDNSGEDVYMDVKTQPTHRVHKESTKLKDMMGELYSNPICPRKKNESDEAYKLRCAPLIGPSVLMNLPSVSELKGPPPTFRDLVGNQYKYVIGSSEEKYLGPNDKKYVLSMIGKLLKANLYDDDFALNYLDANQRKEYTKFFETYILTPNLKNIDKTLRHYFELNGDKVKFKLSGVARVIIDDMFRRYSPLSDDIIQAYKEYRLDKYGSKLKENSMDESLIRYSKDIIHSLIPTDTFARHANDPKKNREWVNSLSKDMATLLNRFYKEHDINVVVKV